MAARSTPKKECCKDVMNLPEEMEAALQQQGGLEELKKLVPDKAELASEANAFSGSI